MYLLYSYNLHLRLYAFNQLSNPLQFRHEPPGVCLLLFGKLSLFCFGRASVAFWPIPNLQIRYLLPSRAK